MAIVDNTDGRKVRGKFSKKSNEVHRVRNGQEHTYYLKPYKGPASDAQKLNRSVFGKASSIVNAIMADPQQEREWRQRMEQYNRTINVNVPHHPKRYYTVRKYVYAVVREQLLQDPSAKRRKSALPYKLPSGILLHIRSFAELTTSELYEILKARFSVFVCEQHIHYLDEDDLDIVATHFALRRKGHVVAYARLFADAEPHTLRIGRMLTTERGKGFGKYLLQSIIDYARAQGAATLSLHAQTQAAPFYEHMGFTSLGDIFYEAELPHVAMQLTL